MKYKIVATALLVGILLGLVLLPAEPGIAQGPTAGEEVVVSISSPDCFGESANFTIPAGWIGTNVRDEISTDFLDCSGSSRGDTDLVGYEVTGPVSWKTGLQGWPRERWGDAVPETLLPGSYTISFAWNGLNDHVRLKYTLQPASSITCTGEQRVHAYSDTDSNPHDDTFVIPPGCIGTKVHMKIDTSFMPVDPGAGHTDRVGCMVKGPAGWTQGVLWEGGSYGAKPPATLPAGSYSLEMEWHGKMDGCTLEYTLAPGGGAGIGAPGATVIAVGPATTPGAISDVMDLIFCIDLTSSMDDDIGNVKVAAANIVNTVAASSPDYRVAIIGYRDWDDDPMFEDFVFSSDKDTIVANINSLSTFGGGDTPEAVLEALMRGIDSTVVGGWRPNVNKQIILMGDAPPHDPSREGFTAASVAQAAFDADPVVIQSVVVGSDGYFDEEAAGAFKNLADLTGGKFFEAADASEVPAVLERSITEGAASGTGAGGLLGGLTLLIVALCGVLFLVLLAAVVLLLIMPKRRRRQAPVPAAPVAYPPQPAPPVYPQQPAPPVYPQQPAPPVYPQQPVQPVYPQQPVAPPPAPPSPPTVIAPTPVVSSGEADATAVFGSPQAMARASLRVTQGIDTGQQYTVGQTARIGRSSDNDIMLRDTHISRHHAAINFTGSGYTITDLGSPNGTTVNGTRISQPCQLRSGDTIGLGDERLVFQEN